MRMNKPKKFADCLGDYQVCFYDGYCGEPISWGFPITKRVGTERWELLSLYGKLDCAYGDGGNWYLLVEELNIQKAIEKYGQITKLYTGPRGGFKSIQFGDKRFSSRLVAPTYEEQEKIDINLIEIE